MRQDNIRLRIILTIFLLAAVIFFSGCSGIAYLPGASYGYFIWEEDGRIFMEWSVDKKDTGFEGDISTDGRIADYTLINWEEDADFISASEQEIEFAATLGKSDYSDGISFVIDDYTYIEFDLKINDGYDLSRVNIGGFLENPEDGVFRIEKGYFDQVKTRPWYRKHPFTEFFYKLFSNKYFTFPYIFIMGVIIIEILRITVFAVKKKKAVWLAVSYICLIALDACIYAVLYLLNR